MTLTSMVSTPCPAVPPGPTPQMQRCAGGPHLLFLPRWSNRAPLRGTSPRSLPAAHPLPQRPAPVPGRAVAGLHYAGAAGNHPQRQRTSEPCSPGRRASATNSLSKSKSVLPAPGWWPHPQQGHRQETSMLERHVSAGNCKLKHLWVQASCPLYLQAPPPVGFQVFICTLKINRLESKLCVVKGGVKKIESQLQQWEWGRRQMGLWARHRVFVKWSKI